MCDRCVEIDKKIDHYKWLAASIIDERTLEAVKSLIQKHEAEKSALHPKQE
jgi:hypothetical protein